MTPTRRRIVLAVGAALFVATVCLLWICNIVVFKGELYLRYADVDAGNGRTITIAGEIFHEEGQAIIYSVRDNGRQVVPTTFLGTNGPGGSPSSACRFLVYTAAGGELVAVTEASEPSYILVLHDFRSGFSYPADCNEDSKEPPFTTLLAEIRAANPEAPLSQWEPDGNRIRSGGHWW